MAEEVVKESEREKETEEYLEGVQPCLSFSIFLPYQLHDTMIPAMLSSSNANQRSNYRYTHSIWYVSPSFLYPAFPENPCKRED
jgi:hypothetical protein